MRPFLGDHYGNAASAHHAGRRARQALEDAREQTAAFSPDGRLLATSGWDKKVLRCDTRTWMTRTLGDHARGVTAVAFSRDGKRLASNNEDKTVKIWDTSIGQETLTLRGPAESVTAVAFSPYGRRLAAASEDGTARVWDLRMGTPAGGTKPMNTNRR
jgi:WD40 repeat protein